MRSKLSLFLCVFLVLFQSFAAFSAEPVLASVDVQKVDPEKHRWLYELIIPTQDRLTEGAKAFKSFKVHLYDTYESYPNPEKLVAANLNHQAKIQGKITYVGFVPKRYQYDVIYSPQGDEVTLMVKIHFKNPQGQDLENLKLKMQQAEQIWNSHATILDFKYKFCFQIVNTAGEADFSVQLLDSTRGPYDTNWNRNWSSISIAHEIGHMFGLGDEYQTLSSVSDCLSQSIMCESFRANPMWHHYYFILRRLMN